MRVQFGAVLLTLQLWLASALAQSSNSDIASCYVSTHIHPIDKEHLLISRQTHCRDKIQDSVDGWECSGTQECNCRTDGYLEQLGCCIKDRCDTPSAATFQIPCSPDDEAKSIWYAPASCPASSSESTASSTATGRVGVNAVTSSASSKATTTTTEESSTTDSSSSTTDSSSAPTSSGDDSLSANEAPASNDSSSKGSDNSLALGLGLGLGIPLTLAVTGLLAFLFYRARQRRRAAEAAASGSSSSDRGSKLDPRSDAKMNPFASPEPPVYELSSAPQANAEPLPPNELPTQADDAMDAIPVASEYQSGHSRSTSGAGSEVTGRQSRTGARHSTDTPPPSAGPRTWDSRSTLVSMVTSAYAGTGAGNAPDRRQSSRPSRSVRSIPSRSVRSMTSEMLMRELPDLPPSARQGAQSPEIKTISELP